MDGYRSGHNGLDSKSSDGQPSVGSNPTPSANRDKCEPDPGVFRRGRVRICFFAKRLTSILRSMGGNRIISLKFSITALFSNI